MNNLVDINKAITLDSLEVAKLTGKDHKNLLRDINTYISQMKQANEDSSNLSTPIKPNDYFIESTYTNSQNKVQPCYLLTKIGCEFVANKMTGVKGTAFTAIYTKRFNEMEKAVNNQLDTSQLSPSLQMFNQLFQAMANNEIEQKRLQQGITEAKQEAAEAKKEIAGMREVMTLNPNSWRNEVSNILNKIAKERGGTQEAYREIRNQSYKLLDERAGAKLEIRLTNRRRKVLEETGSKSKADKVSKLDVIADDKRLTEIYLAIVKEMAIKYKVA